MDAGTIVEDQKQTNHCDDPRTNENGYNMNIKSSEHCADYSNGVAATSCKHSNGNNVPDSNHSEYHVPSVKSGTIKHSDSCDSEEGVNGNCVINSSNVTNSNKNEEIKVKQEEGLRDLPENACENPVHRGTGKASLGNLNRSAGKNAERDRRTSVVKQEDENAEDEKQNLVIVNVVSLKNETNMDEEKNLNDNLSSVAEENEQDSKTEAVRPVKLVMNHAHVKRDSAPVKSVALRKPQHDTVNDNIRKAPQKPGSELKPDNFRPLGRLLHDLGLELVREQVYRDLIEIQTAKESQNRLEEREKGQLVKLIEARDKLASRNSPYRVRELRCSRCQYTSSSTNVLTLHHQFGTVSRIDDEVQVCCACNGGFRTRIPAQFIAHMATEHGAVGRLQKKPSPFTCHSCQYEHKSALRLQAHAEKCSKKFALSSNLQPLPGDCDIPLIYRPGDRISTRMPAALIARGPPITGTQQRSPAVAAAQGQGSAGPPSVRALLSTMRSQAQAAAQAATAAVTMMQSAVSAQKASSTPTPPPAHMPARPPAQPAPSAAHSSAAGTAPGNLICEICGKLVDGREALWSHFRAAHHVELSRNTMRELDPWMKCDVCPSRFWTYQGLSRHLLLAHNRTIAAGATGNSVLSGVPPLIPRCHLCGGSQTANPLSHFSAYHNITLLEMYHAKLCCLCNRKLNSGRSFEEHMVDRHSDIFANHDVLRTVLQALTTARYFKSDDSQNQQTAERPVLQHPSPRGRPPGSGKSHPSGTQTYVKKKREVPVPPSSQPAAKTPDKGATAEEVKKLYEDLADIGRPILRSMRHRLSSGQSSSTEATPVKQDRDARKSLELEAEDLSLSSSKKRRTSECMNAEASTPKKARTDCNTDADDSEASSVKVEENSSADV